VSRAPLVLLHPLGSDGSFWASLSVLLGREALSPDLLGHGGAGLPPARAGIADWTEAVLDECDRHGVDRPTFVGVSLGGLVAQDLAIRHPDRVDRLVLVDTVPTYPGPFRESWHARAATARREGLAPLADAMAAMWFTDEFRRRSPMAVRAVRERFLAGDPEGYARTCEALAGADTTEGLAGIAAPTLVVCGDQDAPAFLEAAPQLASAIPDARLVWLGGGRHAAVLEQPETFAAAVLDFVGEPSFSPGPS
jgi:3-oxoadipate enol-lactonase